MPRRVAPSSDLPSRPPTSVLPRCWLTSPPARAASPAILNAPVTGHGVTRTATTSGIALMRPVRSASRSPSSSPAEVATLPAPT